MIAQYNTQSGSEIQCLPKAFVITVSAIYSIYHHLQSPDTASVSPFGIFLKYMLVSASACWTLFECICTSPYADRVIGPCKFAFARAFRMCPAIWFAATPLGTAQFSISQRTLMRSVFMTLYERWSPILHEPNTFFLSPVVHATRLRALSWSWSWMWVPSAIWARVERHPCEIQRKSIRHSRQVCISEMHCGTWWSVSIRRRDSQRRRRLPEVVDFYKSHLPGRTAACHTTWDWSSFESWRCLWMTVRTWRVGASPIMGF